MMSIFLKMVRCDVLFLNLIVTTFTVVGAFNKCNSVHLQNGISGIIECSFQEGISTIAWYNPESLANQTPLIRMIDGKKVGHGFSSGEFDIRIDGSLVITNVTFTHHTNFTVLAFPSEGVEITSMTIQVVVVVKPSTSFPVVDVCPNKTLCYTQLKNGSGVSCHIANSRPAITLQWVARTLSGDLNLLSKSFIVSIDRSLSTSHATTEGVFLHSSFLSLLVCKAESIPEMLGLQSNESMIFIENIENPSSDMTTSVIYIERYSTLKLICSKKNISLVAWKKALLRGDKFEVLVYAAFFGTGFTVVNSNDYILHDDGSLIVPAIDTYHDGSYACIYESLNDNTGGTKLFDVFTYVHSQPVVQGCTRHRNCVLKVQRMGNLTCFVKGIRPKVLLTWKAVLEEDASLILFSDHQITTDSNGDVFNVVLKSRYQVKDPSTRRIMIACLTTQINGKIFNQTTRVELFFDSDLAQPTDSPLPPFNTNLLWILTIIILLCLFVIAQMTYFVLRAMRKTRKSPRRILDQGEGTPMILSQVESQSDPTSVFKKELRTKYKYQYDAVQPIPYIRDRFYCVDRVFVEGGFEKLISKDKIEGLGNWEKLVSYHDVTNLSSSSSTRTIIEGDPGYGKSTLTLQLAYDWCNRNPVSPLAGIDILILLRLRQLGGVLSIFRAIKQFILPRDSQLEEVDIQNIIKQNKSTLFILDGFDEYPDQEIEDLNDIISTIKGDMFQENFVVLTSRSFFLPKSFPPQTHRIRLTGFDSRARDAYIRKAVAGDNTTAIEKIKKSLQKNSVLQGLCQVPLFFVMFAHMTHESERFLKFKSVTMFFKYMITCFHSHMKNKMKDVNVKKINLHENNHAKLDEVAFLGLCGKNQQIVWMKEDLVQRLGKDFYNQYRSIGILVEEEILDITDKHGEIQYKTEVKFYHKLFHEWYAAHYLSREVMKRDTLQTLLQHMSPFDLQYTYRFACGLNPDAGNRIIDYLRNVKDGDTFAVLCILEQSGNFDQIKETIRDMCSSYITIDSADNLLLQGSIVQLLEIGSSNQIPISFLWLKDCFNSIDLSAGSILLKSEMSIPALSTLKELVIGDRGRNFTNEELSDVITYATMCSDLRSLRFCYSLMPQLIKGEQCSSLQSRKVQVFWCTDDVEYLLSPLSGNWEVYDSKPSKDVFEGNIPAKTNLLKSLMKKKYKEKMSAVQVIPSDRDYCLPIEKLFVNCKLQQLAVKDREKNGHRKQWDPVDSYHSIFTDPRGKCKRYVLKGAPGGGKSTLALRMTYDWCEGLTESPLSEFDLFLLVQFTPGKKPASVYTEIRRCVLPRDSPLSDIDIRGILRECTSSVLVLDGLDRTVYDQSNEKCDVRQIMRGEMLKDTKVLTTCLFVPEDCAPGTDILRLTGFDSDALDKYIQNVVSINKETNDDNIKQRMRNNSIPEDLISVPLFATMFAHIREGNNFCEPKGFESSFTWLIECLRSHMENKENCSHLEEQFSIEHAPLSEIAFKGLCRSDRPFILGRNDITKELGMGRVAKYLKLGIFLEGDIINESEKAKNKSIPLQRGVTFYHESFCLWFAARYIAKHASKKEIGQIKDTLIRINKDNLRLLCSYLGELNVAVICDILHLMKKRHGYDRLSKLIILENIDDASIITDIVKEICAKDFLFTNQEEPQVQRAMIHLVKIASIAKISISRVWLYRCYSTVDLRGGNHLQLKSNLSIPVLTTLNELWINTYGEGREITSEEFTGILQYSSKCLALKELKFFGCLLPPSVQAESVSVLRSRNVKVMWYAPVNDYQLNLQSGQWERATYFSGGLMTDEDYQEEVKILRGRWGK